MTQAKIEDALSTLSASHNSVIKAKYNVRMLSYPVCMRVRVCVSFCLSICLCYNLAYWQSRKLDLTEDQQVVLMMSLLRKHFQSLQSTHSHQHGDAKDSTLSSSGHRFLQLSKAKHTLTSSFENLRLKVGNVA